MQSLSLCAKKKKKKGGRALDNWGITVLSIAGKIKAHVLLNRSTSTVAQENTPESQCGFRSAKGTADMIFMLRQVQEEFREQKIGLYAAFVDLTKAFDTISMTDCRKSWRTLAAPSNFSASSTSSIKVSKVS